MVRCNAASPVTIPPEAGTPRTQPYIPSGGTWAAAGRFPRWAITAFTSSALPTTSRPAIPSSAGSDDEAMRAVGILGTGCRGRGLDEQQLRLGDMSADAAISGQLREDWMGRWNDGRVAAAHCGRLSGSNSRRDETA